MPPKTPKGGPSNYSSGARGPKPNTGFRQDGARDPKTRPSKPPKRYFFLIMYNGSSFYRFTVN